jgi:hypothetical protein
MHDHIGSTRGAAPRVTPRAASRSRSAATAALIVGGLGFAGVGLAATVVATPAGAAGTTCTSGKTYKASGTCTIPAHVSTVTVEAAGAVGGTGGAGSANIFGGTGGDGAIWQGTFSVSSGQTLQFTTGKIGSDGSVDPGNAGAGGNPGGGTGGPGGGPNPNLGGGGGGGGFSSVVNESSSATLLIAGGGGGGGGGGNVAEGNANDNGGNGGGNGQNGAGVEGTGGVAGASTTQTGGAGGGPTTNEAGGGGGGGGCNGGGGGSSGSTVRDNGSGGGGGAGASCGGTVNIGANPKAGFVKVYFAPASLTFSPAKGKVGAEVTISGKNLIAASAVTFNGVPATVQTDSNTSIRVTVPSGATTGPIAVTTPGGTATSTARFKVKS